jgi:hypothetical protein
MELEEFHIGDLSPSLKSKGNSIASGYFRVGGKFK